MMMDAEGMTMGLKPSTQHGWRWRKQRAWGTGIDDAGEEQEVRAS